MRFFYRIKVPEVIEGNFSGYWEYSTYDCGYIEADSKKDARIKLEEDLGIKFCMRSKREDVGVKNFHLLSLYEPNDYFDDLWLKERECKECSNTFNKLERDQANNFKYLNNEFCSKVCQDANKINEVNLKVKESIHNACIYRIFNKKTKKSYIGQTTQAFTLRWYQHFFQSKSTEFHKEISESSLLDWTFEILEQLNFNGYDINKDSKFKEILDKKEDYYIKKYNSIEEGYNSSIIKKEFDK